MKNILISFICALCLLAGQAYALPAATCNGGRFKPCVCWREVPKSVSYVPSSRLCKGNAAVILRDEFISSFSVVVRDKDNRDRWPSESCAVNSCSVFKVQKVITRTVKGVPERVNCLGAPGSSSLFKNVVRITIKLKDVPGSNKDPLARLCLRAPDAKLN